VRAVLIRILLLCLMPVSNIFAEKLEYNFYLDSIKVENESYFFSYQSLKTITINDKLTLPVKTIYLETTKLPTNPHTEFQSKNTVLIESLPDGLAIFDNTPTGVIDVKPLSKNKTDNVSSPLFDLQRTIIEKKIYLILSLLPITIDSSNNLIFHQTITVDLIDIDIIEDNLNLSNLAKNPVRPTFGGVTQKNTGETCGRPLGNRYVIITTADLKNTFETLSKFRTAVGISADIALVDSIGSYYSGLDRQEKIRNYLKDFYQAGGEYVLLGGDNTIVPARYVYYYNTGTVPSDPYYLMPSDLYYADLSGDWNSDGDEIWGEPTDDTPDLIPELIVGRLPVQTPERAQNYIDKLIQYFVNPGNGDYGYLTRSFFFSSDQMRDNPGNGQHGVIAGEIPDNFLIDTISGVEASSGDDPSPSNDNGRLSIDNLSEGFGLVHIIAHGRTDGFVVKSAEYMDGSTSFILTGPGNGNHGSIADLEKNSKTSLYYSLSCNSGGYDLDSIDGAASNWSFAERLITADSSGAIGYIANARWGWVYASYYLQQSFTKHLFAEAEGSPPRAMYLSWLEYPYYRDLIYGQNYFGDPALSIYREVPTELEITLSPAENNLTINITGANEIINNATITIMQDGELIETGQTDNNGAYSINSELDAISSYQISAFRENYTVAQEIYVPLLVLDIDEENKLLPDRFYLEQNYPNPFNPTTTISFSLDKRSDVHLEIINILGRTVKAYSLSSVSTGEHSLNWDGLDNDGQEVPSGVYLYRLTAGDNRQSRKMILMK